MILPPRSNLLKGAPSQSTSQDQTRATLTRLLGDVFLAESLRLVGDLSQARVVAERTQASLKARGLKIWLT